MEKTIFVISDLHLGGEPGFQICSPSGQQKLAEFVRWAATQKSDQRDINLVLAGDIVDFLAEEPFEAFTATDKGAADKLAQIITHTQEVWGAFRDYVAAGGQLTLMLGNHDIELSLPAARRLLLKTLGAGRIEFIYDNEAFVDGKVLIEHGNRYDPPNNVDHDILRQVRSALSRNEDAPKFPSVPGSKLVIEEMNPLKKIYQFIDLLKPENETVVPILAVINPASLTKIAKILGLLTKAQMSKGSSGNISAVQSSTLLRETEKLVVKINSGNISAKKGKNDLISRWKDSVNEFTKNIQLEILNKALNLSSSINAQHQIFDITNESASYLNPAKELARKGFQVIVFGHTHAVKQVELKEVRSGAFYLNSGTWADLMRLPKAIMEGSNNLQELASFLDDIKDNNLDHWRYQYPTFIQIDFFGESANAEAKCFHVPDKTYSIGQCPVQDCPSNK